MRLPPHPVGHPPYPGSGARGNVMPGVMAKRLGISEKTVRNYLTSLYARLGASDRATGALAARQAMDPD